MQDRKKLFLIDGMALIYRAYYAMINNPLKSSSGISTSAIFGLALGLPDEKVVHFDTEGALLMNLGVLASVAGKHPKNFVHFLRTL